MSTQGLPDAVIAAAAEKGVQLDAASFIRTELLPVGELPVGSAIVVFTSQRAVEAVPAIEAGWRIFCISGATQRVVEKRFGADVVDGSAPSAEELASVIVETSPLKAGGGKAEGVKSRGIIGGAKRVLFFCGDLRRGELPALLRQAGYAVEERIVYRTLLSPRKVEREYAGIAFFSPSGVESFFSMNTVGAATNLFAIGRTTSAAVLAQTGREAIVASQPDKEILINEMITYLLV